MHALLRVDGGPTIGYGHLMRMRALTESLQAVGHAVRVATATPAPARAVLPDAVSVEPLPARDAPAPLLACIDRCAPDVVVTDAYPVDTAYQEAVRAVVPLAVVDDDARHAVCADWLINGNLYAASLAYATAGPPPVWCVGPRFALVRRAVRTARDAPPSGRAVITFGGSDRAGLTPMAVTACAELGIAADAVVGPGVDAAVADATVAAASAGDVRVVRAPDDLPERIAAASFVLTTASSTVHECLTVETPIIAAVVAANQRPIAAHLAAEGLAVVLDGPVTARALRGALRTMATRRSLRDRFVARGADLVDGGGAARVVARLEERVG